MRAHRRKDGGAAHRQIYEGRQGERHPGPQPYIGRAGLLYPVVLLVRLQRLLHRFDDGGRDIGERQPHLRQYQPGRSCGNLCGDDHYLEPLQKARRLDDAERFSGRLVAITAGCDAVDPFGAAIIGLIAGFAVVFGVEFIDQKLKIDDPVGAIGVHFVNGALGTVLTGLFATDGGLFYGGGFGFLGVQMLGVLAVCAWVGVAITLVFFLLKKTIGLRVSREEEIDGLDIHEHGLISAYADFAPMSLGMVSPEVQETVEGAVPAKSADEAVPVVETTTVTAAPASGPRISKVVILLRQSRFDALKEALSSIGVTGLTVTQVLGCGVQKGQSEFYRGVPMDVTLLPKVKVEVVVSRVPVRSVIDVTKRVLYTGHIGDGKIFVYNVENVVKVRTGEEGVAALQDTH